MNNFSFIIRNVVANEIEVLENLLTENDYMEEVGQLDNIKNELMELEKKVRFKNVHK